MWHINVVTESPGESKLIEVIRLDVIKKISQKLKSEIPENTNFQQSSFENKQRQISNLLSLILFSYD